MYRLSALLWLALSSESLLGLSGCMKADGTEAGGPCNQKGICLEPLVCDMESKTCKGPDQMSWQQIRAPGQITVRAVWGPSETDLWAVASNGIYHYAGDANTGWEQDVQVTSIAPSKSFADIWGRGDEIWAVGEDIILHRKGGSWTKQELMNQTKTPAVPYTDYSVYAVGGSATAVWSAGYVSSKNQIFKLQVNEWVIDTTATLDYSATDLAVVDQQVFVVGNTGHVLMHNGAWVSKNLDGTYDLNAIWGPALDNILAVGPAKNLLRCDGSKWNKSEFKGLTEAKGISGTASENFYVVGVKEYYSNNGSPILHCTPGCVPVPLPEADNSKTFNAVWTGPSGAVIVVGSEGVTYQRSGS